MTDGELETRMVEARARQRRNLLLVAAVVVPLAPAAMLIGFFLAADDGEDVPWLLFAIMLAAVFVMWALIGGLFYLAYRRGVWWMQTSPAMALPWRERRGVLKAVRAGEHRTGFEELAARDLARRLVTQRWLVLLVPLIGLVNLVPAILAGSVVRIWLWAVFLVVMLVATGFIARDVRAARRFLSTVG